MQLQVFSIFDEKGQIFSQPFFLQHQGIALRSFGDLVNDPQSQINKHASDYKLYKLGTYDDQTGALKSEALPIFLANASEFKQQQTIQTNSININQNPINPNQNQNKNYEK